MTPSDTPKADQFGQMVGPQARRDAAVEHARELLTEANQHDGAVVRLDPTVVHALLNMLADLERALAAAERTISELERERDAAIELSVQANDNAERHRKYAESAEQTIREQQEQIVAGLAQFQKITVALVEAQERIEALERELEQWQCFSHPWGEPEPITDVNTVRRLTDETIREREAAERRAAELERDAKRLDRLEEVARGAGYPLQLTHKRDPHINAGIVRYVVTTGVNSGPWKKSYEAHSLRAAIDAALAEKGACPPVDVATYPVMQGDTLTERDVPIYPSEGE